MKRRIIMLLAALTAAGLALLLVPTSASAQESISVSPSSGAPGTKVTVTGSGWEEHGSRGITVPITIDGTYVATARPSTGGTFHVRLVIPGSASAGQVLTISAIIGNGGAVDTAFTVAKGSAKPQSGVPAAPSNARATAPRTGGLLLEARDNANNETGFQITDGLTTRVVPTGNAAFVGGLLSYNWNVPSHTYKCFKVRAYNQSGASSWTPWACGTSV
jgi:hypothetical protein